MNNSYRNEQILALRGKLSYTLIGRELGISRNVVAGVCNRAGSTGKRKGQYAAQYIKPPGSKAK